MTDCPNGEMRDLLPDLVHSRLGAGDRATVEAHVAQCADCRDEVALLRALRGTMARGQAIDVRGIVGALPAYAVPARRAWGGWRAAAIAAIAIGGASVAMSTRGEPAREVITWRDTLPVLITSGVPSSVDTGGPVLQVAQGGLGVTAASTGPRARELSVSDAVTDLSDSELSALLAELETLDVLPSLDEESTTLVPATALPATAGTS